VYDTIFAMLFLPKPPANHSLRNTAVWCGIQRLFFLHHWFPNSFPPKCLKTADGRRGQLCNFSACCLTDCSALCYKGCSKNHANHGLLGICVSWTPRFKETVASTIPGLKPPRLLFMGASQGYCVFKSSTHIVRASGQHSARCGQDINWHIAKRVR
jgi:hypothetical protein